MRGGPSVWTRTARLEATRHAAVAAADLRAMAARVAAEVGVSEAAVLAEAAALTARCRAAGATTPRAMAAVVAAKVGCTVDEVWAEAERVARRRA